MLSSSSWMTAEVSRGEAMVLPQICCRTPVPRLGPGLFALLQSSHGRPAPACASVRWSPASPDHAMHCSLRRFPLTKAIPLTISRGTTAVVERLMVSVEHGGITGFGETGGFETGHRHYDSDAIAVELEAL